MSRKISSTINLLDITLIETSDLDISDYEYYPILERIRVVENTQKEILLRIPTRGEWILYWGRSVGFLSRNSIRCTRKRLKENISRVQKHNFYN